MEDEQATFDVTGREYSGYLTRVGPQPIRLSEHVTYVMIQALLVHHHVVPQSRPAVHLKRP